MSLPDLIQRYCETVCQQVRWKKIRPSLFAELEQHMTDQADSYRATGASDSEAVEGAVRQMGDAVSVGAALDRTHRPKPQWDMLALTLLLFLLGVGIRLYLAPFSDLVQPRSIWVAAFCGIAVFFLTYFLDFSILGKHPKGVYFSAVLLSIVALLTSSSVNGRAFWHAISCSHLSILFPLVFALLVYALRGRGYGGILLCFFGYLVLAAILSAVPSLSGVLLLSIVALLLLCVSLKRHWFDVKTPVVATAVSLLLLFPLGYILSRPYFQRRLTLALHPEADPMGAGWLTCSIRALLRGANWFHGGSLPNPAIHDLSGELGTQFILTQLISRVGWLSLLLISALFLAFLVRGFVLCFLQKSVLGQLVSLSILTTFTVELLLYLSCNLGFQMISPLFLPFLSYGTVSLVLHMALLGVLLSVFRNGAAVRDTGPQPPRTSSSRNVWTVNEDGTFTIDLRFHKKSPE